MKLATRSHKTLRADNDVLNIVNGEYFIPLARKNILYPIMDSTRYVRWAIDIPLEDPSFKGYY